MIDQSITFNSKVQWFEEIMDTYGTLKFRFIIHTQRYNANHSSQPHLNPLNSPHYP